MGDFSREAHLTEPAHYKKTLWESFCTHILPPNPLPTSYSQGLLYPALVPRASLIALVVNNLPAMETWALSLGWEDPLEKEMATHSSTLAWRIPWAEKPGRLQSIGLQSFGHNGSDLAYLHAFMHTSISLLLLKPTYAKYGNKLLG